MGCVASKLEEEEEVVSICRDRKRQIKLAVEKRFELAEAHSRYCHSLYAVAAAIGLFVSRHSSPSSPFLITFDSSPSPPETDQNEITNNPMFLQQKPSESTTTTHEASMASCESCVDNDTSSISSDSSEEEETSTKQGVEERDQNPYHGYFYMQPPVPSPQRDFGWDFFNPFDGMMRPEVISGYRRSSGDDLRVVREEEGIPELEEEREEEEEKVVVDEKRAEAEMPKLVDGSDNGNLEEQKGGLTVIEEGRELLEALKDIQEYFIRAHASGKDVSRMLEVNQVRLQSGLEEIKGMIFFVFFPL